MSANCQHNDFTGNSIAFKRTILLVITINALLFCIEMFAGFASNSQALKADALDFLADTLTYAISLWAVDKTLTIRNSVAKIKAYSLIVLALSIFGATLYRFVFTIEPEAVTMSSVAFLAFLANFICVLLLLKFREGDANIRSVWLCSRNDMINNVFVIIAGVLVYLTHSAWPDLIAALIMSIIFLSSAIDIIKHSNKSENHLHD